MKFEQFAYWLQGFVELTPGQVPSKEQWELIGEHLAECFDKVTPPLAVGGHTGGYVDPKYGMFAGSGSLVARSAEFVMPASVQLMNTAADTTAIAGLSTAKITSESSARAR